MPRLRPTLELEQRAWEQGFQRVAGVDEAGRGPLAGPLVVAAVVLGDRWNPEHPLNDSKQLSAEARDALFTVIRQEAHAYRIVVVSPAQVDEWNILQATLRGMARSLERLKPAPDYALIDGNRLPELSLAGEAVVKGDTRSLSIAAASILAKVVRDRLMQVYGRRYPEWGFAEHMGYPTRKHREAIAQYGLSPIHRRSFRSSPRPEQLSLL